MFRFVALSLFLATPALSAEIDTPRKVPPGWFLGDDWRYEPPHSVWHWTKGLFQRSGADLISIPTNLDTWGGVDLLTFMLATAVSVGATVPIDGRSLDARIMDGLHTFRSPNCTYAVANSSVCKTPSLSGFRVWTELSSPIITGLAVGTPLVFLLGGVFTDNPALVEAGTLAIEAFAVSQFYHLSLKLFTGREGPLWGDGSGTVHGPSALYYPDGWPSGHSATFFTIATVYATYFEQTWLRVLVLGTAAFLATMMIFDDAHFASDVLLGSTIGVVVGRWVVHHRSSRYTYGREAIPIRLTGVAPLSMSEGGLGISARFSF